MAHLLRTLKSLLPQNTPNPSKLSSPAPTNITPPDPTPTPPDPTHTARPVKRARTLDGSRNSQSENETDCRPEDLEDTPPTIDDPESRPKVPLPKRTMDTPLLFPNPFDDVPPEFRNENPHLLRSRPDPPPVPNDLRSAPYTKTVFPRLVLDLVHLLGNIDQAQETKVKEFPNDYLAIVVFNGGKRFFNDNPNVHTEIEKFIHSIDLDTDDISIARARTRSPSTGPFDKPWTMFLTGASEELKNFLLWQQTFAINRNLAFHVVPFDATLQSWVIGNFKGSTVRNTNKAKLQALGTIKSVLWQNPDFRAIADKYLAPQGIGSSTSERAIHATSSFELTFIETLNSRGETGAIWQLTGKPIATNFHENKRYINIIMNQSYLVDMDYLTHDKPSTSCTWCKSPTHAPHSCPFLKVHDWLGPLPPPTPRPNDKIDRQNKDRSRKDRNDNPRSSPSQRRGTRGGGPFTTPSRRHRA